MKNYLKMGACIFGLAVALTACRNEKADENKEGDMTEMGADGEITKEEAKAEMNMDADAEVKMKDDKIKMEDENKEVKIKMDEETGTVEKIKVDEKEE